MNLAIVSQSAVEGVITRDLAYAAVREAFEAVAAELASVSPVAFGSGLGAGEMFTMKAGTDALNRGVGLKVGSYWPANRDRGLPAHGSTVLLLDPDTGFPLALISAALMNGFRTAAADALAVDVLARRDATVLGVIGAGHQAEHEIRAVAEVRALTRIKVFTRSEERRRWLAGRLADLCVAPEFTNAEAAVRDSDIVVTVTPSNHAIVEDAWVAEGTHVSAMGADAPGKQELETGLVARARKFADLPEQSMRVGEFQHAAGAGLVGTSDVTALGAVTAGCAPGRESSREITVFDSSGIAIQDLAVARSVLAAARERGLVTSIEW